MPKHTETRWAVLNYKDEVFCGVNCWVPIYSLSGKVPTFPTRALAREAIRDMRSYRGESRPVKVTVTIKTV